MGDKVQGFLPGLQPQPVSVSGLLYIHGAGFGNFSHSRSIWHRPSRKKKAPDPGATQGAGLAPAASESCNGRPGCCLCPALPWCCSHKSNCWRGRQRSAVGEIASVPMIVHMAADAAKRPRESQLHARSMMAWLFPDSTATGGKEESRPGGFLSHLAGCLHLHDCG